MEQLYTIKQVAEHLQVSRKTVYDWMSAGRLRYVLVGEHRRIPQSALEEFIRPGEPETEGEEQKKLAPALAAA